MNVDDRRLEVLARLGIGPRWTLRDPVGAAHAAVVGPVPDPAETSTSMPEREGMNPVAIAKHVDDSATDKAPATGSRIDIATVPTVLDWSGLGQAVSACTACGLCQGRKNAVLGTGDRNGNWLFVGEGPGRQEDIQGEPFVGPAGKLLDNMLKALGLQRQENTYIANVVKCRPVGADGRDRPPTASEMQACLPFLQRQIELIQPSVIVALGKTAAIGLLGLPEDTRVGSLRGRIHHYQGLPVVVTYHPAYLLRQPADKALAWRDLCMARAAHAAA